MARFGALRINSYRKARGMTSFGLATGDKNRNPVSHEDGIMLTQLDVDEAARMFYLMDSTLEEIASRINSSCEYVRSLTRGLSNSIMWEKAVIALVVNGVECKRDPNGVDAEARRAVLAKRRLIPTDVVIKIRELHREHMSVRNIGKIVHIRDTTIRGIVKDQTYRTPEFYPKGVANEQ